MNCKLLACLGIYLIYIPAPNSAIESLILILSIITPEPATIIPAPLRLAYALLILTFAMRTLASIIGGLSIYPMYIAPPSPSVEELVKLQLSIVNIKDGESMSPPCVVAELFMNIEFLMDAEYTGIEAVCMAPPLTAVLLMKVHPSKSRFPHD